jgi:hypothetical protein
LSDFDIRNNMGHRSRHLCRERHPLGQVSPSSSAARSNCSASV